MDVDAFLDEVLNRVKEFLNHSQQFEIIRNGLPHDSLRKTIDLKLPIEGHGIQSALDDIDSVLRHSVHTTAPGFMNPLWGGCPFPRLQENWLLQLRILRCIPTKSHQWPR